MKVLNNKKFISLLFIFTPFIVFILTLFTTSPQVYAATTRINLLTTDNFAVLAGSAISDTVPTSVIIGDVGLSPGGGAAITGLTCAEVTGTIYDTNGGYTGNGGGSTACLVTNAGLLTTAQNDLTTAYTDAANRPVTSTIATNLGGTVLTDGVYHAASDTFSITGGQTLTLDGQGNADAVFIFKMGTSLTTGASSSVILINGAQACNVYWQVGSAATLGTGTTLVGNILAQAAITDDGGSTVNGRLLARTSGAVTLNNTHVTTQTCAAPGITPGVTLTPTPGSTTSLSSSSSDSQTSHSSSSSVCPTLNYVTPIIIESERIDKNSIFIRWGPYSGTDTFNVRYGLTNGSWLYNTDVTGFSTIINALPSDQPIWMQVATRNTCSIGTYGEPKLVGGPALPHTGMKTNEQFATWLILASICLFACVVHLSLRKKRFSFK